MNDDKSYKMQFFNAIKGCFVGGAAGDALGYPIEFFDEGTIFHKYGSDGICEYELDKASNKALISDDTQMTMFTANGILVGKSRMKERGIGAPISVYVRLAYLDWLKTQDLSYETVSEMEHGYGAEVHSWICDIPELFSRRAPGNTCLNALHLHQELEEKMKSPQSLKELSDEEWASYDSMQRKYINNPLNHSKGCGGVMRVAPLAMAYDVFEGKMEYLKEVDKQGAEVAAITHGHSLGYLPAAVLVHILQRIIYGRKNQTLEEIVLEAKTAIGEIFEESADLQKLNHLIDLSVELSKNDSDDLDNIHCLGQGWVAEEALAIALYCSLKYTDDFSKAIITAVNHEGDSDSTGAITGNIVGALVGYDAIEEKWKENLELLDVILELSEDICFQDPNECTPLEKTVVDETWETKYWEMRRVIRNGNQQE